MKVKFATNKKAQNIIKKIVERAMKMDIFSGTDHLELTMDISACHANGNPLDFEKLLKFDDFNFLHDVFGINCHMDRNTGKLKDFFLPRCSLPQKKALTSQKKRGAA